MNLVLVVGAILVVGLGAASFAVAQTTQNQRQGLLTMRGNPLTLVGPALKVGDRAPDFVAAANDLSAFSFKGGGGQVWILSSVPSLDTSVCSTETRRFNQEATKLPGVKILTISMDLPFAQKRWCGAEGINNVQTVSDYKDHAFAGAYGVYIKENGLLARAVFVVDKSGKVAYVQLVPELTHEPDYAPILEAAQKAAKQ